MGKKINITDCEEGDFFYKEAIKTLRANIQFTGKRKRIILITSAYPGEGKTDTVFHLSIEMAGTGKRVLLIDADIRSSVLSDRLNVEESVIGLSEYLSGQVAAPTEAIYSTNYENLDILFAGDYVSNASELLSSSSFQELLNSECNSYDFIFVDSPPLSQIIDAAIIAQHCDGAVLVIESGAVSYRSAQKIKTQIERTGCPILGVVLNRVSRNGNSRYGSKYGKYGKYGGYGLQNKEKPYEKKAQKPHKPAEPRKSDETEMKTSIKPGTAAPVAPDPVEEPQGRMLRPDWTDVKTPGEPDTAAPVAPDPVEEVQDRKPEPKNLSVKNQADSQSGTSPQGPEGQNEASSLPSTSAQGPEVQNEASNLPSTSAQGPKVQNEASSLPSTSKAERKKYYRRRSYYGKKNRNTEKKDE